MNQLLEKDMVYLGEFEGWYDEGQEEYVTEKNAEDQVRPAPPPPSLPIAPRSLVAPQHQRTMLRTRAPLRYDARLFARTLGSRFVSELSRLVGVRPGAGPPARGLPRLRVSAPWL